MSGLDTLADALQTAGAEHPVVVLSEELVDLAEAHGVDALLAAAPAANSAGEDLRARLKGRRAAHALLSAARDREVCRVLDALDAGGVRPVVIKGAHLAHAIYPEPGLRPRADTDMVVAVDERSTVEAILERLGYRRLAHVRGDVILGQWHFHRDEPGGVVHALDVHWRIAAPLVFRDLLPAPRLRDRAVPIPPLGAAGRGPALEDALVIACVHVVAHHRRDPLLLWLYEIAALARALDGEATGRFVDTARKGRVVTACAAAFHRARRYFDGDALRALARTLDAAAGAPEPSAAILRAAGPLDELWIDLKACDGWRERAALVREHAYPDSEYMQAAAGHGRWAYARRLVRGLARWTALSAAPGRTAARDEWPAGSAAASPRPRSARTTR